MAAYFGVEEEKKDEVSLVDVFSIAKKNTDITKNKAPKKEKTPHYNTKANGNVKIEQSTYTAKEKVKNEGSSFFEEQRRKNEEKNHFQENKNQKSFKENRGETESKSKNEREILQKTPFQPKKKKEATTSETLVKKTELFMDDKITVKEFSEKIGVPVTEILAELMKNKILTNINASLDFDTVSLIAAEF